LNLECSDVRVGDVIPVTVDGSCSVDKVLGRSIGRTTALSAL